MTGQRCARACRQQLARQRLCVQVAKYIWRGVERGQYVIGSPDGGSNMLVGSSLAACSARFYPVWLELLLAPLFVVLHALVRRALEASTRRILAEAAAAQPVALPPAIKKLA